MSYDLGMCLEGLRKTTKTLNQYSRCPDRDSNPAPPENKSEVLQLEAIFFGPVVYQVLQ
jgi:hypothetical protein